jgi:coatomer protein complex subunit alpha (xenin)
LAASDCIEGKTYFEQYNLRILVSGCEEQTDKVKSLTIITFQSLFEGAALTKAKPTLTTNVGLMSEEIDVIPVGGWGDDDMQLDDEDGVGKDDNDLPGDEGKYSHVIQLYHYRCRNCYRYNKYYLGGGWDIDEDLELPTDVDVPSASGDDDFFVAPTKGVPIPQQWTNSSKLAIDHVLAGNFESAARLLNEQIGVVEIRHFKQLFLSTYSRARASYTALPNMPSLYLYPLRNWKDQKSPLPAVGIHISDLISRLQVNALLSDKLTIRDDQS